MAPDVAHLREQRGDAAGLARAHLALVAEAGARRALLQRYDVAHPSGTPLQVDPPPSGAAYSTVPVGGRCTTPATTRPSALAAIDTA